MCLPLLNLTNFEVVSAEECPFVLTSPRSLKACRRAGVKPIDLLYKCLSDVEFEDECKENAKILYEAYEGERQHKLAVCRALRNELLLNGYWYENGLSPKSEKFGRYPPKSHGYRDRRLPVIGENYLHTRTNTPENMRPKSGPDTPRTAIHLPKVNLTLDKNQEAGVDYRLKLDLSKDAPKDTELILSSYSQGKANGVEENGKTHTSHSPSPRFSFTEDINNNVKIKKKRLNSSSKRRSNDQKKHSKVIDHKKAFQNMLIQYSDPAYCTLKYKQVIENSVERDLKELDVQRAQREMDVGMERWQDRVLLLQWLDVARATEQAARELEIKVEKLQQKNRAKNILHSININKVREAEDMKAEGLRRQVQDKERKILYLHQEKERVISESKSRALSIQELKEHIRNIETPETFDQKVAKVSIHRKVLDAHMCARMNQNSHICLGHGRALAQSFGQYYPFYQPQLNYSLSASYLPKAGAWDHRNVDSLNLLQGNIFNLSGLQIISPTMDAS